MSHISRGGGQGEKQELLQGAESSPPRNLWFQRILPMPQICREATSPCILIVSLFKWGEGRKERGQKWLLGDVRTPREEEQISGTRRWQKPWSRFSQQNLRSSAWTQGSQQLSWPPQAWPWLEPAWTMPLPALSSYIAAQRVLWGFTLFAEL